MSTSTPSPPRGPLNKNLEALKSEYTNVKHPSAVKLLPGTKDVPVREESPTQLTKSELLEYVNDPFWTNVRRILLGGTVATFVVFFVSALALIYFRMDCTTSGNFTRHTSE